MSVGNERRRRMDLARLLTNQKVRFVMVGGFNTVFGYGLYVGLYALAFSTMRFGYLWSLVGSYAISITLAFFLYRRFVFRVSGRVRRDFVAFVSVNALAIGSNLLLLPFLVEVVGVPPLPAQGLTLVCTTLITYFGHRDVSFRRSPAVQPRAGE